MGVSGGLIDGGQRGGGLIDGGSGGFHEEDHPRDAGGRFAPGTGADEGSAGAGSGTSKPKGASSPSLSRPGFHAASDEERKQHKIPSGAKGWTDVHIADDPKARLVAVGRDQKGRQQSKYSAEHTEQALQQKFERNRLLNSALPGILHHTSQEIAEKGKNAEEASVIRLIEHTGARVGSDSDTGASEKAYGATTLEARHVIIDGDVARLDFVGKLAKRNQYEVSDPAIVDDLKARVEGKEPSARVFNTTDAKTRDYLKTAAGGQAFKVHDLRTHVATRVAAKEVEAGEPPTSPDEYWKRRDAVGQKAANQINDTLDIALGTYVNPMVFENWRSRAGVAQDAQRPTRGKAKAAA